MQSFTSVPFKTKTDSGLSHINGVAKFSSAGVVLEFESKLLGMISTGVKEARISIGEIHDVVFKKGFLKRGARIEIRSRSMVTLKGLPNTQGKVVLSIETADYDTARSAVEELQRNITAHTAAQPPAHTPLSELFNEGDDETRELKN